jgi:hypothetical protein
MPCKDFAASQAIWTVNYSIDEQVAVSAVSRARPATISVAGVPGETLDANEDS